MIDILIYKTTETKREKERERGGKRERDTERERQRDREGCPLISKIQHSTFSHKTPSLKQQFIFLKTLEYKSFMYNIDG